MDDYIKIPLEENLSCIDFHFYSFFGGTAHEIANFMFDKLEGVLEYKSPVETDEDGNKIFIDTGKLSFTVESGPSRGWFKDEDTCDVFKFLQLMDATLSHQNIELNTPRPNALNSPMLFPHFVGLKVKTKMPNLDPDANDSEMTIFPSSKISNMRLFDYNSYRTIDPEAYMLDIYDTKLDGLAVSFSDFGFRTVKLPKGFACQIEGIFHPFEFDLFDGGQEDEQA